jgi:two-component system sensor histidine kinase/response regulator
MLAHDPDPVRFLLVDDTPENLVALEALLVRPGLEILKARSGTEALELLLTHEVALAFLDVQMPGMDGFELAELMRGTERTKNVPIIFVTAGTSDPHRIFKGYDRGAVDFLFKPIEPHILRSKADVFFELYRQRRDLASALRLNEMFVGILGHDLRSPLSTLVAGAQILEKESKDEDTRRIVQRMVRAGDRMNGMIRQMLDLTGSRLGGGVVGSRRPIDLLELTQSTIDEVLGGAPDRQIDLDSRGVCVASADPIRIQQVLANLLTNAIHHGTREAPVQVRLAGEEEVVTLSVENGGAIPPEVLPSLFDPFRSGRSPTSRSSGLGLGLFISKQILEEHGGSLDVASSPREGTRFVARLPR